MIHRTGMLLMGIIHFFGPKKDSTLQFRIECGVTPLLLKKVIASQSGVSVSMRYQKRKSSILWTATQVTGRSRSRNRIVKSPPSFLTKAYSYFPRSIWTHQHHRNNSTRNRYHTQLGPMKVRSCILRRYHSIFKND